MDGPAAIDAQVSTEHESTAELLVLYELALAIGQTLDVHAMCRRFLRILLARLDLQWASVWWLLPHESTGVSSADAAVRPLALLEGVPRRAFRLERVGLDHPLWAASRGGTARLAGPAAEPLAGLVDPPAAVHGQCVLLPLGRQGVLALALKRADDFGQRVLGDLRLVTDKLATAIEGALAVERELQQRRRIEELVDERTAALSVAKEVAESASRAKNAFLANMSHELRTPLSAIIGMNELALRRATDDKQREHLYKVAQASRHLLGLIDEILDLSRIEAGRLTLEQVPFRLSALLQYVTHLSEHKASAKGLELVVDAAPGLQNAEFAGDPLRLSQVLLNLLGNAVKFTSRGSVVLRVFAVAETPQAVTLRFEVTDTGVGISLVDQQRLFIAFEQAESGPARSTGGAGLGLMIAKRLVQAMGGEIGVQSTFGQGSTFWFRVRLDKSTAPASEPWRVAAEPAAERLKASHADARVLLVEDEPTNQLLAVELMAAAGIQADVACDGAAAVDLVRSGRYDLVLMDMRLRGMGGVEATQAIRAIGGFEELPIVAMTASVFEADRRLCREAGMNDFISKPVAPELLYATLLKWLVWRRSQPAAPPAD